MYCFKWFLFHFYYFICSVYTLPSLPWQAQGSLQGPTDIIFPFVISSASEHYQRESFRLFLGYQEFCIMLMTCQYTVMIKSFVTLLADKMSVNEKCKFGKEQIKWVGHTTSKWGFQCYSDNWWHYLFCQYMRIFQHHVGYWVWH